MDSRYRADRGLSTAMRDQVLRLAILAALSTAVAAQPGPPQLSREWYAQFSGPFSQPQGHVPERRCAALQQSTPPERGRGHQARVQDVEE